MSRQEIEAWATAYIQAQQDPTLLHEGHPLWWAVEKFMMPATDSVTPEDCWAGILEVLARDPPESVKGILAAGALEDLIDQHGPEFMSALKQNRSAILHFSTCSAVFGRAARLKFGRE